MQTAKQGAAGSPSSWTRCSLFNLFLEKSQVHTARAQGRLQEEMSCWQDAKQLITKDIPQHPEFQFATNDPQWKERHTQCRDCIEQRGVSRMTQLRSLIQQQQVRPEELPTQPHAPVHHAARHIQCTRACSPANLGDLRPQPSEALTASVASVAAQAPAHVQVAHPAASAACGRQPDCSHTPSSKTAVQLRSHADRMFRRASPPEAAARSQAQGVHPSSSSSHAGTAHHLTITLLCPPKLAPQVSNDDNLTRVSCATNGEACLAARCLSDYH